MKRSMAWVIIGGLLWVGGCGTAPEKRGPGEVLTPSESRKVPQQMIVYVPLTDDDAGAWLTLFSRYLRLRMVLAISPRFRQFEKRPELRAQIDTLMQAGRLELALQLPNPPVLPLIMNTADAKESLPTGSSLPNPAFSYPDDIVQLIARAKSDYFKTWKSLPKGFVLPYGAVSPATVRQLERLGFAWAVASLGGPDAFAVYRTGPLLLWDASPRTATVGTLVRVWDERIMGDSALGRRTLESWAKELELRKELEVVMPSDFTIAAAPIPPSEEWKRRTWTASDWSAWIGSPAKNTAWMWLRKTRDALETFKNSGQASVKRLDLAYEEILTAESAGYFSAIGNSSISATVAEEREREFKATLASVYKLIGQNPPEALFQSSTAEAAPPVPGADKSKATAQIFPDKRERVVIEDPENDAPVPANDLRRVEVVSSSETVQFAVTLGAVSQTLIDIYIDQNHTPEAGTSALLPGRSLTASASDAWEYALTLSSGTATLFRTQAGGTFDTAGTFPVGAQGATLQVSVPRALLRGSPSRWGYQLLVLPDEPSAAKGTFKIFDLLDPPGTTQAVFFETVQSGIRSDVSFLRVEK